MDFQTAFTLVIAGGGALIMWFLKRTITANEHSIELLQRDVQHLRDTRLHKDDFKEFKLELRSQFDEIKQAIRDIKLSA